MQKFAEQLRLSLDKFGPFQRRHIQHILNLPDTSRMKQRVLGRLQDEALASMGLDSDAEFDWAEGTTVAASDGTTKTVNWANLAKIIQQVLAFLLPLLGGG